MNFDELDEKELMRNLSVARVGLGAAGLLAPRMFTRTLLGRGMAGRAASFLVRIWATREVALGMATLHEMDADEPSTRLVELNAAVDAVDGLAAVVAWGALPRRTRLATVVGAVAAAGVSANFLRATRRG